MNLNAYWLVCHDWQTNKWAFYQCTYAFFFIHVESRCTSMNSLTKLCFHFLSHWMGYDHGDSFPFDFEPNGIPFGSKENCYHDHVPLNVKGNVNIVFPVNDKLAAS